MDLFTSISKTQRNLLILFCTAVVIRLISAWYVACVSPPALEQREVRNLKRNYAARLDREADSKIVFVGGSSTSYGVMPSVIKETYGIDSVNAGLHAGMGAGFLMLWGCMLCEPGDTLVLMIEPALFKDPYRQPVSQTLTELEMPREYWAMKRSFYGGSWWMARPRLSSVKSSGEGLTDILGKVCRGWHLSGDWMNNMTSDGHLYVETRGRPPGYKPVTTVPEAEFPDEGINALKTIRSICDQRRVRVCYVFPPQLVAPEVLDAWRVHGQRMAETISTVMPVLNPNGYGMDNEGAFLESNLHLNAAGARQFSTQLGKTVSDAGFAPSRDAEQQRD